MENDDAALRFVAGRIRELREEKSMTQQGLALAAGLKYQSQISEWEGGKPPEMLSLFRVIRALGVTPSYFFRNGSSGQATERLIAARYVKQYAEQLEAEAATLSEAEDEAPPGGEGSEEESSEGDVV